MYTAIQDFNVIHVNKESAQSLTTIIGPSFERDVQLFAFSSNHSNEKTILDAVQAVCVQHDIKGLHRYKAMDLFTFSS